ncbi:starch-binding protein [Ruminococcus sp.]|uniref:starch-binding protein n=1 Tax=Ruminococcus sp. TaxID=41978 RepID=UPI0025CECBED|nr:starch-binding protein [Ruminococcus sp.]MCI6616909.1 starch-binding protein [Ruminococcus sp.]
MSKKIMSVILALCMTLSCLTAAGIVAEARTTETAEVSAQATSVETGADYVLVDDVQDGQILQCWNWSYNGIKANMQKIAEQGFSAIQTSPIQTIKETTQNRQMSGSWWVFYQPSDFKIDTSSQNALGTKSDFKSMCDEAHKYGVKVIVDAVLNHMANNGDNTLSPTIPSDIRNDSSCWHSITTNTSNWNSRWDITHNCMGGLPDLNTGNSKIQNYEIAFLKECIDAGADGFRFDGAKHIEVPNDYENASSNFWSNVLGAATSYAKSSRGFTPYYYGEILDSTGGGQSIVNQYTNYMSVTCNTVSDNIRSQVNSGNASGAKRKDFCYNDGSQPAASKAVLWNESHDTYANGSSRGQSDTTLKKTWALVGSRAQACGMYLARPSSYSNQIGTASVTAWGDVEVKAVNQFKNYFVGKTEYLSSEGSIAYNERGTEGVVLVNCGGSSTSVSVTAHKMAAGTYTDQITGNTFTVSNGKISGKIGSTGVAVVYNAKPAGPSAYVTPGSQSYNTDTLTLTLNYKNATSGQYSINGGSYTSFTDGKTITIGSGLAYGTKTTVSVKATDGTTTSDIQTYTYTKIDPSLVQKVYFDNSSYNWSSVYAYIYADSSTNNGAWPGAQMTKDSATGYYVIEVPEELSNGYVILTESKDATSNRYPADGETGMALNGKTMIMRANHSWEEYTVTPATTAAPTTQPTTATPTTVPATTVPADKVLIGDTNIDGKITISDATEIQYHISEYSTLTGDNAIAADTDKNGTINIKDATVIQYYLVGLIESAGHCGEYTGGETPTTQPMTTVPVADYVYYYNSNGWSSVNAYYWSDGNTMLAEWPGVDMESVGNNVYRTKYPSAATYIIFSNNGSNQTSTITLSGVNKIYKNGSWSTYNG